jgi:hypothetical protein
MFHVEKFRAFRAIQPLISASILLTETFFDLLITAKPQSELKWNAIIFAIPPLKM